MRELMWDGKYQLVILGYLGPGLPSGIYTPHHNLPNQQPSDQQKVRLQLPKRVQQQQSNSELLWFSEYIQKSDI